MTQGKVIGVIVLRMFSIVLATLSAITSNVPGILFAIYLWLCANTFELNWFATDFARAFKDRVK